MTLPTLDASARLMYLEALSRGITCTVFDDKQTILMQKGDLQWYTKGSRTSLQSSVGKSIADNKVLTKKVLAHFKLPTAKFAYVTSEAELEKLNTLTFPVVLKPTNQAHGRGVIIGLSSIEEAKAAYLNQEYSRVLFEEMLVGQEYRVVCVDFKCVAAAFRKPAFVTGDGEHTIQELVDEKNKHPWRGKGHENNLSSIEIDEVVIEYLTAQDLTPSSILAVDQEVKLRKTANLSTGGEAWDVTAQLHPQNRELVEEIARACDLNVLGIDIMCQDLTQPLVDQPQAGVIEVNASPGLRMHHFPIQGEPKNVAGMILDMVEKKVGSL